MRRALLLTALVLLLPSPDATGRRGKKIDIPEQPTSAPQSNVFIRASFDEDPSAYIGRFIKDDAEVIDETSAFKTTCSEYITYRSVGGGGVQYDDLFHASTDAAMRLGIPGLASGSSSGSGKTMVRVTYTLTDKMIADISDPAAFDACCEENPDQCTGKYVGEFMGGTGAMWYIHANAAQAELDLISQGLVTDVQFQHGTLWKRSIQFPNPVYFAFKTTDVIGNDCQVTAGCGEWIDKVPTCSGGLYFVGMSKVVDDETLARNLARQNAREQVLQWAETERAGGTSGSFSYGGSGEEGSSEYEGSGYHEERYSGVTSQIKDRNWCIKEEASPGGTRYKAYSLSFLPQSVADNLTGN